MPKKKVDRRKRVPPPVVFSWLELQKQLRACETSSDAETILREEIRGPSRLRWLLRINGRLGALRTIEEAKYLNSVAKE